ncbi:MAG TPA: PhoU domain-containing protein [Acidimicrobiales bacterium]|jgi:phosphate transport system protein
MTVLGPVSGETTRLQQSTLVEPAVDIDALDSQVIRLFSLVAEGIAGATTAFLASARQAAALLVAEEEEVDAVFHSVEDLIRAEVVSGTPSSEPRLARLLVILQIVPELERSGDLVDHIRWRARQGLARSLTPTSRELVERMGQRAAVMWRAACSAYLQRDRTMAERLRRWDDELDDLHVTLTVELATTDLPVATAIEMGLVARFLERLGDHAVNVARRLETLPSDT